MKQLFASAMGQYDNVGDTVLRRPFLRALRQLGPLNVFVGTRPDEYLSGLGLDGTERLYRDSSSWRRAVRKSMAGGRALYAFNAGEIEATRPYAAHYIRLAPLLAINRLRGGNAVHVGLGVRATTRWVPAVRSTLRLCDEVTWRDRYSESIMDVGGYAPDWAFAEGASDEDLRARTNSVGCDTLVVAPRYNGKALSGAWAADVSRAASSLGLQIVVVAQIGRDNPVAEALASEMGGEAVLWEGADHATHEQKLRATYSQARVVVSERLHALVIGATEGAVPVAIGHGRADKAWRTVTSAGLPELGIAAPEVPERVFDTLRIAESQRNEVSTAVIKARHALQQVELRLREIYG